MDTNELRQHLAHEKERGRKATQVSVAELEALVDALEAAEGDAGRYRWLRGQSVKFNLSPYFCLDGLDERVDAAMKESAK